MNLLGKSLIVLIFVMAIFFMASSVMVFATHENWKTKHAALQSNLQQIQASNSELQSERDKLERQLALERAARAQSIAALESQFQQQSQELLAKQQQLDNVSANAREQTRAVQAATDTVKALQQQVDTQKSELFALRDDVRKKFEEVLALTDSNYQLEGMKDRVESLARDLRTQLGKAEQVLRYNNLEATAPVSNVAPRAEGRVVSVRGNLVQISLGKDDGIRPDHELDVSRGDLYLGRIRITKVEDDSSVGEILEGFRRGGIQGGDRVRTQVR
ncbi:MAG: hypothetical protein U0795_24375 [Pirellulales bacterium]